MNMSDLEAGKLQGSISAEDTPAEAVFVQKLRDGLTPEEIQYLTQNPDLLDKKILELKGAVQKHQNPRAKQMRETKQVLDAISPKSIYDAVLSLRAKGINPTHRLVQVELGATAGLFQRLHYAPGDNPIIGAQNRAYDLAIKGAPWTEEATPPPAPTEEMPVAIESKEHTLQLMDLAHRNERARAQLTEFSVANISPGKVTTLAYRVAEISDRLEDLRESTKSGWNADSLDQLLVMKNTIEEIEKAIQDTPRY